jgi:RNA polymerase sigma-70 factor (ECF subfamily)
VDDEAAVLAYLSTRDPRHFQLLVERHHARVFRLVASLLGPYADLDAQEVTQEVFLRVCQRLETFNGQARFATWLYRLAYNRTLEHRRRARIRLSHVSADTLEQLPADTARGHVDEERQRLLDRLLEELPDLYRTVINMYYWLECPVDEIAASLCVPAGTVKSYLSRARQLMRERAQTFGLEFPE